MASVDAGLTPPTYKLKDITGKKIEFTWYSENLEKIPPGKLTNYFQVDKVLKRRKNGEKGEEFLVTFINQSPHFQRWLTKSQFVK